MNSNSKNYFDNNYDYLKHTYSLLISRSNLSSNENWKSFFRFINKPYSKDKENKSG